MRNYNKQFYQQIGFRPAPPPYPKSFKGSENIVPPTNLKTFGSNNQLLENLSTGAETKPPIKLLVSVDNTNKPARLEFWNQKLPTEPQRLTLRDAQSLNFRKVQFGQSVLPSKYSLSFQASIRTGLSLPNCEEKSKMRILSSGGIQKSMNPNKNSNECQNQTANVSSFAKKTEKSSNDKHTFQNESDADILDIKIKKVKSSSQEQEPRNQFSLEDIHAQYMKPNNSRLFSENKIKTDQPQGEFQRYQQSVGQLGPVGKANELKNDNQLLSSNQSAIIGKSPKSIQFAINEAAVCSHSHKQVQKEATIFGCKSTDGLFTIFGLRQNSDLLTKDIDFKKSLTTTESSMTETQEMKPQQKHQEPEFSGYDFMTSLPKYNLYFELDPLLIKTLD